MSARSSGESKPREFRNAKAGRDYFLGDRFEAGLVLRGTEIKSIRAGHVSLAESFCRVDRGEVFVHHLHVAEYDFGNRFNHPPLRPRKLLLNAREIRKVADAVDKEGKSLVPVRLYFKQGLAKLELAIGVGKKQYDKREDLRRREQVRGIEQALKRRS